MVVYIALSVVNYQSFNHLFLLPLIHPSYFLITLHILLAMILYYAPDILSTPVLPEEESQHCVRVLRHTRGDEIVVTDGQGTFYTCRIVNPSQHRCEVEILRADEQPLNHTNYVHIIIAPTKNMDRLEWMIEKCVEIGVDEITPIVCRYSERKNVNEERLQKIVISAAKQSLKARFPKLNPLTPIMDVLSNKQLPDGMEHQLFIAHCYDEDKRELSREIKQATYVQVLIGPEGDFSEQEIRSALEAGYIPVSLGNSRLRTETAGLVACHTAILIGG